MTAAFYCTCGLAIRVTTRGGMAEILLDHLRDDHLREAGGADRPGHKATTARRAARARLRVDS